MNKVKAYFRALAHPYTYDVRRNLYVWFGFLWGIPIPLFSMTLALSLVGDGGKGLFGFLLANPVHFFFLMHPLLFAGVFGAMGTLRHELERENTRLVRRFEEEAITDPLTGLRNRRFMFREIAAACSRAERAGASFAIVMVDLNGFKSINEAKGHPEGDRVLKLVADGLASVVRQGDSLGRYGGDEFMLLIHGDGSAVETLLKRASAEVIRRAGLDFEAGTAFWATHGKTAEALIQAADDFLVRAKRRRYAGRPVSHR